MIGIKGQKPYDDFITYGPYFHKEEGRKVIVLVAANNNSIRTSMSYARYLMSCLLGRVLATNEQVDHIDGNKSNDDLSNLQILTVSDNIAKYHKQANITRKMVMLCCPNCGDCFSREQRQTHLVKNGIFTACSRECSGRIRRNMQLGLPVDLTGNILYEYRK